MTLFHSTFIFRWIYKNYKKNIPQQLKTTVPYRKPTPALNEKTLTILAKIQKADLVKNSQQMLRVERPPGFILTGVNKDQNLTLSLHCWPLKHYIFWFEIIFSESKVLNESWKVLFWKY